MAQAEERRNEADNMQMVGLLGERGNAEGIIEPMDPPEDHSEPNMAHSVAIENGLQPLNRQRSENRPTYLESFRNVITQLLDCALLSANASQIRILTTLNSRGIKVAYFYPVLVLSILSISLQVTFACCVLMIRHSKNKDEHDGNDPDLVQIRSRRRLSENNINTVCNILLVVIVVINIFVHVFVEFEGGGKHKVVGDVHNCTQMVATTVQP